jgi:GAF domain-containing protein
MAGMVPLGISDVRPWRDWPAAAHGVLEFLHDYVGWDAWMVTRVVGDRQIVLCAVPPSGVSPGARLVWEDSFCHEMVEGRAPRIATVTAAVPPYAARTKGKAGEVAAYLGVPLVAADGQLFGTLCGVSYRAKPRSAARELAVVETMARLLSTLLVPDFPAESALVLPPPLS